ncbi:MAG TPA: SHOCT domain-containing protein [Acidimicrobiales bacterium]|nr:SHOCT domain-containing protein [Acidimicrobiales bacterium]
MGLMFRRRRPIARLAVGAATAATQDQPPPPPYVAPPPASTGGEVDELSRLVQMHDSGSLSDDEFAAAKAQLLDL